MHAIAGNPQVQTLDDLRAIAMTIPRTPHPVVVT
jgi:hypothetical protein